MEAVKLNVLPSSHGTVLAGVRKSCISFTAAMIKVEQEGRRGKRFSKDREIRGRSYADEIVRVEKFVRIVISIFKMQFKLLRYESSSLSSMICLVTVSYSSIQRCKQR